MLKDAEVILMRRAANLQREADIAVILEFAKPWIYHAGGMVGALREAPMVTDDPRAD